MSKGRMNISESEYQAILAKQGQPIPDDPNVAEDEPESALSKKIRKHCKDKGWIALILPQNKLLRFFIPQGFPDGVIALPEGRTVWLELKAGKKDLREAQRLMGFMLRQLGHEYYKVRTWKRYLEIVYEKGEYHEPIKQTERNSE